MIRWLPLLCLGACVRISVGDGGDDTEQDSCAPGTPSLTGSLDLDGAPLRVDEVDVDLEPAPAGDCLPRVEVDLDLPENCVIFLEGGTVEGSRTSLDAAEVSFAADCGLAGGGWEVAELGSSSVRLEGSIGERLDDRRCVTGVLDIDVDLTLVNADSATAELEGTLSLEGTWSAPVSQRGCP